MKPKALISCAVTVQLICAFVFAYAKIRVSYDAAQMSHYEKMSMLYTVIFHGCKQDNFQMKKCDVFLIFAQNIDFGYTLEPPQ